MCGQCLVEKRKKGKVNSTLGKERKKVGQGRGTRGSLRGRRCCKYEWGGRSVPVGGEVSEAVQVQWGGYWRGTKGMLLRGGQMFHVSGERSQCLGQIETGVGKS